MRENVTPHGDVAAATTMVLTMRNISVYVN